MNANSAEERALLVAVEFAPRRIPLSSTATMAREAARLSAGPECAEPSSNVVPSHLDAASSLEEFRELVTSAGAHVSAEIVQRRPKADPATLIGSGKVLE